MPSTTRSGRRTSLDWGPIIERAAAIVRGYDTPVTLRQLFYRLVVEGHIDNTRYHYQRLSNLTAHGRRHGTFPDLVSDRGIHRLSHWRSPAAAVASLGSWYTRDRTAGQPVSIYLAVEKATMTSQLNSWFEGLGLPVVAFGGYAGQSHVDVIRSDRRSAHGRPAVLVYAGDFDPSGEDILRDFLRRTAGCWQQVVRVAVTAEQVEEHDLPTAPGKETDSRAAAFVARHGDLVQVELEAMAPELVRDLYQQAIDAHWDQAEYDRVIAEEEADRAKLDVLADLAELDLNSLAGLRDR